MRVAGAGRPRNRNPFWTHARTPAPAWGPIQGMRPMRPTTSSPLIGLCASPLGPRMRRAGADGSPRRVKLSFKIPYRCSFGQEVCMVGNAREMGRWDVTSGVAMRWTEGDVWTVEFEVDAG